MRKFEEFRNSTLLKSEMKLILGGGSYKCTCIDSVGTWSGNYGSLADAEASGGQNCSSGAAKCRSEDASIE